MSLLNRIDFTLKKDGFFPKMGKWKIFTDEEANLAKMADKDFKSKEIYVNYYKENDKSYYDIGIKLIKETFKKFNFNPKDDKEMHEIIVDMIYSLHRFGFSFDEYFLLKLRDLSFDGREKFISDKVRYYLYNKLNLTSNHLLFRNKEMTYAVFKEYYKRQLISIKSDNDYELFLDFIQKNKSFIVKPIDSDCGHGAKIYKNINVNEVQYIFNEIRSFGNVVLEELIIQSKEMSSLHPSSVNTVRIVTIKTSDSIVIFHPFLRMGRNGSIVDNAGAGGIFVSIDPELGICYYPGVDEFGNTYITHPNTGIIIPGFKVPKYEQAIHLVKNAAKLTTNCYVGWDLAHTKNGWVIVEGNDCAQFIMQYCDKIGRLDELLNLIDKL